MMIRKVADKSFSVYLGFYTEILVYKSNKDFLYAVMNYITFSVPSYGTYNVFSFSQGLKRDSSPNLAQLL